MKSVSIIGATGIVGREVLNILHERAFPVSNLKLFSSKNSAGEKLAFGDDEITVQELKHAQQIDTDIAFFAAGAKVSRDYVDLVAKQGTICIDKSSALRMRDDVDLVVAGVNDHILANKKPAIIASPNCVATPLVQVLAALQKLSSIEHVVISTYQAVSGAGKHGTDELESQVRDLFNLRDAKADVFGQRIAFNVLPFIPARSTINADGKTEEEWKVIDECRKILALPSLKIEATCVRVPVFNGHSMAASIATSHALKINEVLEVLGTTPGIILVDDPTKAKYPTPLDASGEDMTLVGRIRPYTAVEHGVSLWIVSDNLRTGAALNAVRIAEKL